MVMTRKELATMTDAEILVHYRREHGNPFMSLSTAKELHHLTFRYLHQSLRAEARRKGIPYPKTTRPGRSESGRHSITSARDEAK